MELTFLRIVLQVVDLVAIDDDDARRFVFAAFDVIIIVVSAIIYKF